MRRMVLAAAVSSVVTALVIGGVGVLFGHLMVAPRFAEAAGLVGAGGPPWQRHGPPPHVAVLFRDIPAGERFQHLESAQLTMTDKDAKVVTFDLVAGTVKSVSGSSLELELNGGGTRVFQLDAQTYYYGHAASVTDVKSGDKALVSTMNGAGSASAVVDLADAQWSGRPSGG